MRWRPRSKYAPSREREADIARKQADERLKKIRANTDEVQKLAEELREHRRSNHYTELIRETYRRM